MIPVAVLCSVVCVLPSRSAEPAVSTPCTLFTISADKAPVLENGRMSYALTMEFSRVPENYLSYYDPRRGSIVIDVYGTVITNEIKSFPRNLVFKDLSIENLDSQMSLSGEGSHIVVGADPDWHISATSESPTVLRLVVSRMLGVMPSQPDKKNSSVVTVVLCNIAAGFCSAALIAVLSQLER